MRRKLAVGLVALFAFASLAALPGAGVSVGDVDVGVERASAQKEGGSVEKTGDNLADLGSDIVGPILLFAIGAIAAVAMAKRETGLALGAVAIGLVAALFIYLPTDAQDTMEGVWQTILPG